MEIQLHKITIGELVKDYVDNAEAGVKAYGGLLDVRPPYQREFVYNDKERDAVIDTVTQNFPLNVMYWSDRGDGTYEIIDAQKKRMPAGARDRVTALHEVSMYTEGEDRPLMEIFDAIKQHEGGKATAQWLCLQPTV